MPTNAGIHEIGIQTCTYTSTSTGALRAHTKTRRHARAGRGKLRKQRAHFGSRHCVGDMRGLRRGGLAGGALGRHGTARSREPGESHVPARPVLSTSHHYLL